MQFKVFITIKANNDYTMELRKLKGLLDDGIITQIETNIQSSFMMAISQSGETKEVLNNVRMAKEYGFQIVSFTRVNDSALAQLSDVAFLVEPTKQVLLGQVPNRFLAM